MQSGRQLTYNVYCSLLLSAAQQYDIQCEHAQIRLSNARFVSMRFSQILKNINFLMHEHMILTSPLTRSKSMKQSSKAHSYHMNNGMPYLMMHRWFRTHLLQRQKELSYALYSDQILIGNQKHMINLHLGSKTFWHHADQSMNMILNILLVFIDFWGRGAHYQMQIVVLTFQCMKTCLNLKNNPFWLTWPERNHNK